MFENKVTEFKREYTDEIKYEVIAFANTEGGKIYIGMNDDGSVYGVEDVDSTMLRVTNMIRDVIRPDVTLFVDCGIEKIDDKNVVVLTIQRGTARPYYLYGKGVRPEGVYVRQGASAVPASETAILNMIKETSGDCYEEARSLNQQLTFDRCTSYFNSANVSFGEVQMRTLNIISQDGLYSNLGMLLSDQCTHSIKMAVFEGSKKSIFHDRRELKGSILQQLEEAYSYIDQYNRTRAEFEGLRRIDKRDYPEEAIREALLNAIVHRDYAISAPTLISIFDDRVEITTIGGLVRGITYDDVMLGISVLRNQHLAEVFYRLKLIEAYGTGMMKINECYTEYSVKPLIEVTDNAFKITLPNTNFIRESFDTMMLKEEASAYADKRTNREAAVVNMFRDKETITRKDIECALNVSQATAILILRELVSKGTLVKESAGKYQKYRLKRF